MSVFPFIEAEKAEQRNVAKACELLEVSRSAFYSWHQHLPSAPCGQQPLKVAGLLGIVEHQQPTLASAQLS